MGDRTEDRQHDQGAQSLTDVSKRSSLMYTDVHGSMDLTCADAHDLDPMGLSLAICCTR